MNIKCGAFEENLFSRMEAQNNLLKGRDISILEKEIWNAVIEKAAKVGEKEWRLTEIGNEIRKLKV